MSISRAQLIQAQTHTNVQRALLTDLEHGRLIWNDTEDRLEVYNGTAWVPVHVPTTLQDGATLYGDVDGGVYL